MGFIYIPFPETNSKFVPEFMDGWNMILSFWGFSLFSGAFAVSFRECIYHKFKIKTSNNFPGGETTFHIT